MNSILGQNNSGFMVGLMVGLWYLYGTSLLGLEIRKIAQNAFKQGLFQKRTLGLAKNDKLFFNTQPLLSNNLPLSEMAIASAG